MSFSSTLHLKLSQSLKPMGGVGAMVGVPAGSVGSVAAAAPGLPAPCATHWASNAAATAQPRRERRRRAVGWNGRGLTRVSFGLRVGAAERAGRPRVGCADVRGRADV